VDELDPQLITTKETAKLLRVSVAVLYLWARQGRGPRRLKPTPGMTRYDRREVLRWLHGPEVKP